MNIKQFFRLAVVALALSATACSDEIASQEDNQDLVLKDGETAVQMNIAGINGKSLARAAGDNVTLSGEVKIDKLDIYCFVDLDAQNTSAAVTGVDNYTLERVYKYVAQGSTNDIVLTPDGDGYKASFGVVKNADRKRAFILVANDGETRTAVANPDITVGNDRSTGGGATAFSAVKAWNVLETALSDNATNFATPLVMQSTAQWSAYDTDGTLKTNNEYDAAKLAEGISAELTRRVARIDINNPVATGFTVTDVTLTGAKNATLFKDIAAAGTNQTVAFAEKTVTNAEVINAALYALPMNANDAAGEYPTVAIKGKLGTTELTLTAKFAGDPMTATTKGMQPNTRYVVNIINTEGNLTAYITIADWVYGETVDTDDIAARLNSGATLAEERSAAVLFGDNNKNLYVHNLPHAEGTPFATITGTDNDKPIGIVLPDDCNWLKVVNTATTPMTYQLQATDKTADERTRPLTVNLSIITYDAANKKQVINEYLVYKEYTDMTHLDKSFLGSIWDPNTMSDSPVFHLPPFGIDAAIMRASDLVIPEGCTWLFNKKMGDLLGTSITDNIGKPERQVVVTQRWIPGGSGLATREVTIIQSGTVDKTILSPTHEIVLNNDLVNQGKIKFDETLSTIIIAGSGLTADDVIFDVRGIATSQAGSTVEPVKPIIVQFGENCDWWAKPLSGSLYFSGNFWGHEYKVPFPVYPSGEAGPRETEFTVTTYNGKPIEKTYRLIQLGRNTSTVN
ncbi:MULTISPECIES: hypothetical protein [unclassified Butyricimonas]|uniref:hypothetical protein n=1 Tax=unclassified Butyricimonas TaxID=2637652 RepID=UPI000C06CCCA|nr:MULTISPECIES: hypothetical protein [unclassified Butyricimonas]